MSADATDAFLSGQGIPVDLRHVEAELERLWGPAAERKGGAVPEAPSVTRIALANLVVSRLGFESAGVGPVLEVVEPRFPCRAIVLERVDGAGRKVSAEVSALCHLPAPGRPQVCSERIVLKTGTEGLDLLPGAVRPLLEADLPLVLWWADDPRPAATLFRTLADEATRVVVDLPDPGAEPSALRMALDLKRNPFTRDLAWFGATPWRELVAAFFDATDAPAALAQVRSLRIEAVGPAGDRPPRVALWLAAWLAGALGWEPVERPGLAPGNLDATFRGPSGPIRLEVATRHDADALSPRILAAELRGEGSTTYGARCSGCRPEEVRVAVDAPEHSPLPRLLILPEDDAPRRLAAALESARDDPPYRQALPILLWLLDA